MLDSCRRLWRDPDFIAGARDISGTALGIGAWGLVTGVAMVKGGLGVGMSLLMTMLVFAGSAQLSSVPLIAAGAPIWVIWATAACVNLRFVIFSAGWRSYFGGLPRRRRVLMSYFSGDLNYVLFLKRYPGGRPEAGQEAYFWGGVVVNWTAWQLLSIVGILLADQIPTAWGLGFAGTLALLGLTGSLLSDRSTWVAAAVAACAAVAAYALPLRLNIVVAIAAAIAVGVVLDHLAPPSRQKAA